MQLLEKVKNLVYNKYKDSGLTHSESYFKKLLEIKNQERFSIFLEVIELILSNERTIEQEIMLNDLWLIKATVRRIKKKKGA